MAHYLSQHTLFHSFFGIQRTVFNSFTNTLAVALLGMIAIFHHLRALKGRGPQNVSILIINVFLSGKLITFSSSSK